MRKCTRCGRYTLQVKCPCCGADTRIAHPPPFKDRIQRILKSLRTDYISSG
ncbi:hypothetical protein DRN94_002175 [archaeon]|nr:hypothetical protein [archaeon]